MWTNDQCTWDQLLSIQLHAESIIDRMVGFGAKATVAFAGGCTTRMYGPPPSPFVAGKVTPAAGTTQVQSGRRYQSASIRWPFWPPGAHVERPGRIRSEPESVRQVRGGMQNKTMVLLRQPELSGEEVSQEARLREQIPRLRSG